MAFLYLSSAVQGTALMVIENILVDKSHDESKDYGTYLDFITVYMFTLSVIFMIFFKSEMKRTNADNTTYLNDKPIEAWK